jgi:hypothetical protein
VACRRDGTCYSITVRQTTPIRTAMAAIDEQAWVDIVYPHGAWHRSPRPEVGVTG